MSSPLELAEAPEVQQQQQRHRRRRLRDLTTEDELRHDIPDTDHEPEQSPPPQYPASEASSSARPPPFSSLFAPFPDAGEPSGKFAAAATAEASASASLAAAPAYSSVSCPDQAAARAFDDPVAETKRALPRDTKGESSRKVDDAEPPPAYSEDDSHSPLHSFSYVMATAGGASSIITQVQQGGPPMNAIGGEPACCGASVRQAGTDLIQMSAPTRPLRWTYGKKMSRRGNRYSADVVCIEVPDLCSRGTSC